MGDTWLDPTLVINRSMVFRQTPDDVAAAREFVGLDELAAGQLARGIVMAVHRRMEIAVTAFGLGMPRSLWEIVRRGAGNCVSHSVLAAVLLRDHGIPTRLMSENTYTNFSLLRLPAITMNAPIGPVLNSHVWLEVKSGGEWVPADAELGIFGMMQWLETRVLKGVTVRALGLPVSEHWRFPLRIHRLGDDGQPFEDATREYLLDSLSEPAPAGWREGVHYFAERFDWDGRAGLRALVEHRRLARMNAARLAIANRQVQSRERTG